MAIKQLTLPNGKIVYDVYVQVITQHGRRLQKRKKLVPTLRQAKEIETRFRAELYLEKGKPEQLTWGVWLNRILKEMSVTLRPSTMESYSGQLNKWATPVWEHRLLESISSFDVHGLIFERMAEVSPNTQRSVLKMVSRVFARALEEGLVPRNPAAPVKVKVPEVKQSVLTASEAQKLLQEAKTLNHRFYFIWAMALFTGMRSGELYAIRWDDVDFEHGRVFVSRSWCSQAGFGPTKSTRNRIVPISESLRKLLTEIKAAQFRVAEKPEFVLPHLRDWSNGEQAKVLRGFCKLIGITPIKFHDLRATFITQLLMRGVPLAQVMSMVGHSQLKTTNTYLRVMGIELEGATERLSYSLPQSELAQVINFPSQSDARSPL